jgi:hypothetical protein
VDDTSWEHMRVALAASVVRLEGLGSDDGLAPVREEVDVCHKTGCPTVAAGIGRLTENAHDNGSVS